MTLIASEHINEPEIGPSKIGPSIKNTHVGFSGRVNCFRVVYFCVFLSLFTAFLWQSCAKSNKVLRFLSLYNLFSGSLKPYPTKFCVFLTLYSLTLVVSTKFCVFLSLYSLSLVVLSQIQPSFAFFVTLQPSLVVLSQTCHGSRYQVLGIRYQELGAGYQVLRTRY